VSVYYFDANVQVKYYVPEPGSTWVRQIVDEVDSAGNLVHTLFTAEISLVEVAAAISVVHRVGRIGRRLRDAAFDKYMKGVMARYQLIPITSSLLHKAAHLTQAHPLKGYDAVQLAAGLDLKAALDRRKIPMIFVRGDDQLLKAAQTEGLVTENPFDYAHLDPML
jgi:predicted nucleic acid-binding protein